MIRGDFVDHFRSLKHVTFTKNMILFIILSNIMDRPTFKCTSKGFLFLIVEAKHGKILSLSVYSNFFDQVLLLTSFVGV